MLCMSLLPPACGGHWWCLLGSVLGRLVHQRPGHLCSGAVRRDPGRQGGVSIQPGNPLLQGEQPLKNKSPCMCVFSHCNVSFELSLQPYCLQFHPGNRGQRNASVYGTRPSNVCVCVCVCWAQTLLQYLSSENNQWKIFFKIRNKSLIPNLATYKRKTKSIYHSKCILSIPS